MMKLFKSAKKNENVKNITAHVNIHAMLFGIYINKNFDITVPDGTTVKKMLKIAFQGGEIEKEHYRYLIKLKHPFAISVNGNINTENSVHTISDGDKILVFTPISGG